MKRKRFVSTILVLVTVVSLLCGCQNTNAQKETAVDDGFPELRIGVDDLRPFFYIDQNGDYAGIDAEIAIEACRRAGYRPNFVKIAWMDRESSLEEGTVDCIWNAFIKNGREDAYLWTETYMQSELRIIEDGRKPDKDIESIGENTEIAVRAGSKIRELILKNNENSSPIPVYTCGTFEMAETAFVKGYVATLGGHEAALQEIIRTYPELYHFLDGSLMTADLAVAFQKEDISDKYSKMNDALKSMKEDGTITEILQNYTSDLTRTEGEATHE